MDGYTYYYTPYADRPHHELYRQLKPAGTTGLLFGYAGSIMMILMLVYTLRKRTRWLGRKVSLQSMLLFHIYLGIMGPLLIVLHTSFKVQGLVAVSFWSMVKRPAAGRGAFRLKRCFQVRPSSFISPFEGMSRSWSPLTNHLATTRRK